MDISIEPELFDAYPGYTRHVVLAGSLDNSRSAQELPALEAMLREAEAAVRTDPAYDDLAAHPGLAAWRKAFRAFGANPGKCPPSICSLVKRARAGAALPFVNPLVCIFNIVSLRHGIPAGGDDLDKVVGGIHLGRATGRESYTPLGQPDLRERPAPGEVILVDPGNGNVFCRAWCWRNGHSSRIEPITRRVAVNLDALPPADPAAGAAAAAEVADLLARFCGGQARIRRLDAHRPSCELP